MNFYFTCESCDTLKSLSSFLFVETEFETAYGKERKIRNVNFKSYLWLFTFSAQRRIWSFHVVVLQRTAKKCTKN